MVYADIYKHKKEEKEWFFPTNRTSYKLIENSLKEILFVDRMKTDSSPAVPKTWNREPKMFLMINKSKSPMLFSMVQDFYVVPASNTTIERLFSLQK
jgi:hypothetical protein